MTRTEAYIQLLYGNQVIHSSISSTPIYMKADRTVQNTAGMNLTFVFHVPAMFSLRHNWHMVDRIK